MNEHHIVLSIVTVAGLGVGAQWLAWRLKMPAIVLLAAVGLLMGPGLDLIHPSQDFGNLLRPVVSLCVAIILFEGGLSVQLRELKEAAIGVRRLVYLGVPLAWSFSSLCAHYVGASPWTVALAQMLHDMKANVLLSDSNWHNLRPARLAGIPVFYGDILSEFGEESVELAHIRTVLAATRNDAYNALVCTAIAPETGQRRVLQLALGGDAEEDPRAIARPRRGDAAFDSEADFEKLWRHLVKGWTFSKTRLSENYSYADFRTDKPAHAMEVLIMNEEKDMEFSSSQRTLEPEAGDTIVYFPRAEPASGGVDAPVG